jgi:hypothetical protein
VRSSPGRGRWNVRLLLTTLVMAACLAGPPRAALAHDAFDDSQSNPIRMIAYLANPIGVAAEWIVARPFHFLVSQHELEHLFGHVPHENPYGDYGVYDWEHDLEK